MVWIRFLSGPDFCRTLPHPTFRSGRSLGAAFFVAEGHSACGQAELGFEFVQGLARSAVHQNGLEFRSAEAPGGRAGAGASMAAALSVPRARSPLIRKRRRF